MLPLFHFTVLSSALPDLPPIVVSVVSFITMGLLLLLYLMIDFKLGVDGRKAIL